MTRKELLDAWKILGLRVGRLGSIIQNPDDPTPAQVQDLWELDVQQLQINLAMLVMRTRREFKE